ncbi:MAG TPA: class I SAM-dependent methyltransferase [Candidatus Binatia bacterium]|nr:class I SAM-dependent methyltransferase [Candidatus Binatia bacterium]
MSVPSSKNFGPIRDEYRFFEEHATEAAEDVRAYLPHVHALATEGAPIRMLDFGSGSGRFAYQFLTQARFPAERLWLSLVEPEEGYRQQALAQLQPCTAQPVQAWPALPPDVAAHFDLVLANHVFYYVPDLAAVLASILRALTPTGLFLTAMAGQRNILIQFWNACFAWIGQPVPFRTAEDLEVTLAAQGARYRKQEIHYELAFPDAEENRVKILRFLLGSYFAEVPRQAMVELFTPYAQAGRIVMQTVHEQFVIGPPEKGAG